MSRWILSERPFGSGNALDRLSYAMLSAWTKLVLPQRPNLTAGSGEPALPSTEAAARDLSKWFGPSVFDRFQGRVVADLGCGAGGHIVAAAENGAATALGFEIREEMLQQCRKLAATSSAQARCTFLHVENDVDGIAEYEGAIDYIFSIDAFEHILDPAAVLNDAYRLLAPGGRMLVSFGPPWGHPRGVHLRFMKPPLWAHMFFTEHAIMRLRNEFIGDGAETYEQIYLAKMTFARFQRFVEASPFEVRDLRPVPITGFGWLSGVPGIREYFTSVIQCELVKPG